MTLIEFPPPTAAGPPGTSRRRASHLSSFGFFAIAVASLGGPLALAALYAPGAIDDVTSSSGLVTALSAVAFLGPLAIWLRYSRYVVGPGGLTAFVERAAGRRVALAQGSVWTVSYALYLLYTSAYVVYDVLPAAAPATAAYRPYLEVALPVVVAGVVLAPRRVMVTAVGGLAVAQIGLVAMLAVLAIGHSAPASSFTPGATGAGDLTSATGNTALLFVCGSLPLFLGGELIRPRRTIRRSLIGAFAVVAAGVVAVTFPLAADPGFTRAEIPGASVAGVFAGRPAALAVGAGVAASIVGVMIVEYVAVGRLLHALTGRPVRTLNRILAIALVVAGPVSLLDPDRFYDTLLRPSLVALWLSQLVVVAVYPRFAARNGGFRATDAVLTVVATALMGFGLYSSLLHQVAT